MSSCLDLGFGEELRQLAATEGADIIKAQLKQTQHELEKLYVYVYSTHTLQTIS